MCLQFCIKTCDKANEVRLKRAQPISELNDVKAPLSPFDLADQTLRTPQPVRQVSLTQAASFA
jgi:hypothetical protein